MNSGAGTRGFYAIGFAVLLAFDSLAQISFKFAGHDALPLEWSSGWVARAISTPWLYGALIGYVGAFFTWMTILKHAPIGPAFAASHLEIVVVLVLSQHLFGERVETLQWIGSGLILSGIVCLGVSESRGRLPQT